MSIDGRSAAIVAMVARSARIQPTRSPPQKDFDIDPMVMTRSRRVVISAARGVGIASSSHMSRIVSSTIVRVRVSAMMRASRFRSSTGMVSPVGFWLSGMKYARFGASWWTAACTASSSQPASVIATGTGRAPAVVMADSAP